MGPRSADLGSTPRLQFFFTTTEFSKCSWRKIWHLKKNKPTLSLILPWGGHKLMSGLTLKNIFGLFWWCFWYAVGMIIYWPRAVKELLIKGLDAWSPNLSVPKKLCSAFEFLSALYIHEYHLTIANTQECKGNYT